MELILEDTAACLRQGIQLMSRLKTEQYIKAHSDCYDSTIGGHVRHNLDHFFCFEEGLKSGKVDYDARERDGFLETDPEYAAAKMERLIQLVDSLSAENLDQSLRVKMDSGASHQEIENWSQSSSRRELQFLISHTIHHYALIATLCSRDGIKLPEDFGVAPSTLRYRKSRNTQCAQ